MADFTKIEKVKDDLLLTYITRLLMEQCRLDEIQEDGTLYCPDSNASVDPHEVVKYLRDNWSKLNA